MQYRLLTNCRIVRPHDDPTSIGTDLAESLCRDMHLLLGSPKATSHSFSSSNSYMLHVLGMDEQDKPKIQGTLTRPSKVTLTGPWAPLIHNIAKKTTAT